MARKFDSADIARIKAAKAWRPNEGDQIEGAIIAIVPRESEYGRYPVVVLDTGADAFSAIHAMHGVLQNELKEIKAKPGDEITIHYGGKRDHNKALDANGDKRQYHSYTVVPSGGAELDTWVFDTDEAGF